MMGTVAAQVTATATIINMLGREISVSMRWALNRLRGIHHLPTSGLFGVIYTDMFQFVMLILFIGHPHPSASL